MNRDTPEVLHLVIPSEQGRIAEADEFLESALRVRGVPESVISDLAIAATELVNNAIMHGNKNDPQKTVRLTLSFTTSEVTICVVDQGNGFDPGEVPDPLANENLLREVGRGIFIARSLMDEVTYERDPGGGMAVVLRKGINPT